MFFLRWHKRQYCGRAMAVGGKQLLKNDWMGHVFRCQSLMFSGCVSEILDFFFWLCEWNLSQIYWSFLAKRIGCESCFIEPVKTWRQYLLRKLVLMFEEGVTVPHFLNLEEGVYEKRSIETTKAPRVNPRHFDIQVTFHQSKSCGHITHFCRITSQLVLT